MPYVIKRSGPHYYLGSKHSGSSWTSVIGPENTFAMFQEARLRLALYLVRNMEDADPYRRFEPSDADVGIRIVKLKETFVTPTYTDPED